MSVIDVSNVQAFANILLNGSPCLYSPFYYDLEFPRHHPIIKEQYKLLFDQEIRDAFPEFTGFKLFVPSGNTSFMIISWMMQSKIDEEQLNDLIRSKVKGNVDSRVDEGMRAILWEPEGGEERHVYDQQAFYGPNLWMLEYNREPHSKFLQFCGTRDEVLRTAESLPDGTYIRTFYQSHDVSSGELMIPRRIEVEQVVPQSHSIQCWRMLFRSLALERRQNVGHLDLVHISLVRGEDYHRIVLKFLFGTPNVVIEEIRKYVNTLSTILRSLGPDDNVDIEDLLPPNNASLNDPLEDDKNGDGKKVEEDKDADQAEPDDDLSDLDGISMNLDQSKSRASYDLIDMEGITVRLADSPKQSTPLRLSTDLNDEDEITVKPSESTTIDVEEDNLGEVIPEVEEVKSDDEGLEAFKDVDAVIKDLQSLSLNNIQKHWEVCLIHSGRLSKFQLSQYRKFNRDRWIAGAATLLRSHLADIKTYTIIVKQGARSPLLMPKSPAEVYENSAFSIEAFLAKVYDAGLQKDPSEHHLQVTPTKYIYRLNN